MRGEIEYNEASMHGLDFSNPLRVRQYFEAQNTAIADMVEQINDYLNEPRNIIIDGKSLEDTLRQDKWKRGDLKLFYGDWEDAIQDGWAYSDGRNGTPEIHPAPNAATAIQRFLRATAWGTDAGETGGSDTHTHAAGTLKMPAHFHDIPDLTHNHAYSFTTDGPSSCVNVCLTGGDCPVGDGAHTHDCSCNTDDWTGSNLDTEDCTEQSATGSTAAGSSLPSYMEVIVIMKL